MSRPILVTGSHRSGTTWTGRMLCLSGEAAYIDEPFTPSRSPAWLAQPLPYWFMYITEENEEPYVAAFERIMTLRYPVVDVLKNTRSIKRFGRQAPEIPRSFYYRAKHLRPLLKDPLAIFSSEWLASRFNVDVVVMIRHPAAFVSSIKRLNWGFDYEQNWLPQELLMRDLLGHRADEFRDYEGEVDLVGEGIVLWNAIYDVVSGFRERHPDWTFVRYEDLAENPLQGFESLYSKLGLDWTDDARSRVAESSGAANPAEVPRHRRRAIKRDSAGAKKTWLKRLSADEIERIRAGTTDVASRFYSAEDWQPD
jgi:hypothetical protein